MRFTLFTFVLSLTLVFTGFSDSEAQFRDDIPSTLDRTGTIIQPGEDGNNRLFGLVDFQMNHSYEMNMGTFGGNTYNQNYYTNTMHLFFSENLTGRLDLAVAHSPFGNNFGGNDSPQFFVRNASLHYDISDNTHISLHYRQIPAGSMYMPGMMHGMHGMHSPYSRMMQRNRRWYGY